MHLPDNAHATAALPESLVRYVVRTQESVLLDDAQTQNPFSTDPYIVRRRAHSILCLPLINKAKLIGILYLENNLTRQVFTPGRVTVLKVLASQAAISLENSRLYRDLEDREGKIRRLVDSNILGIFIWNFEGAIVEANEAFLRMLQYGREDLVSGRLRWTDLTPAEQRERDGRALAELKATGTVQPYEMEFLRKDGSRMPALTGAALFEERGNQSVAFVLDLTERKKAEERLRLSEARLAEAQRLSHSGVAAYNETTILYGSEEIYHIWGFDPAQGVPSREAVFKRIHPDDLGRLNAEVQRAVGEKRGYSIGYRIVLPNGTAKHLESIGQTVFSANGELVEIVTTQQDVTERKRAEEEHERLRQLESDLAHMNRLSMMGELAASLAHEITQPIASARNNARAAQNYLDQQPPDLDEVRDALGCVVGDADRAGVIVDRIRDHIKKAPPRKHRFDLNGAINEVIVFRRPKLALTHF